jgi:hypothetical protein
VGTSFDMAAFTHDVLASLPEQAVATERSENKLFK